MKSETMDLSASMTEIKQIEVSGVHYSLMKARHFDNRYVIMAYGGEDFYCGTLYDCEKEAIAVFDELAASETAPYYIADILRDLQVNKL